MTEKKSKVFIVDDDNEVLDGLSLLLNSSGYDVESYKSVTELLERGPYNLPGCILLDVFLGEKTGVQLQKDIEAKFECLPIIFISGHGTIPLSVEAMRKGAFNFLQKPLDDEILFTTLQEAINMSSSAVMVHDELDKYHALFNSLTEREQLIFRYIIAGMLNKQIAAELQIAEHTVKNHRLKITDKLGMKSVAELVYLAQKLKIKAINLT